MVRVCVVCVCVHLCVRQLDTMCRKNGSLHLSPPTPPSNPFQDTQHKEMERSPPPYLPSGPPTTLTQPPANTPTGPSPPSQTSHPRLCHLNSPPDSSWDRHISQMLSGCAGVCLGVYVCVCGSRGVRQCWNNGSLGLSSLSHFRLPFQSTPGKVIERTPSFTRYLKAGSCYIL
eukprot:GHVQ01002381.1.p1 GENE.GHVQ01002381.1~~GHVQ01002381.1.p1  ORF type:complete len:173 (+),score=24.42 GHVQ01002381.1:1540-2058(+)